MEIAHTTAHALNTRAQQYVNQHPHDTVAIANGLIDEAIRLQNAGQWEWADDKLAKAEALLASTA